MDEDEKCVVPDLPNCDTPYDVDQCYKCDVENFWHEEECQPNSDFTDNCLEVMEVDTDKYMCRTCKEGFHELNYKCYA